MEIYYDSGDIKYRLTKIHETLFHENHPAYYCHTINVYPGTVKLGAKLTYCREHRVQLYLSIHGPDGFRGNRMNLSGYGELSTELWIGVDDAGPGCLPGPIAAGEWTLQIDIDFLEKDIEYTLDIYAVYGECDQASAGENRSVERIIRKLPGWYKGELHCHSMESDGDSAAEDVINSAVREKLDFLAITDHFTCSQWRSVDRLSPSVDLALLHSCEITSHNGHANMHGLDKWVDVFVNRDGRSMNDAADDVHRQDGLFCVNHAFSGGCSWKAFDFDWKNADLMEIYHEMEGPNNLQQIAFWDHLLVMGYRIIGVAGTDRHTFRNYLPPEKRLLTYIYSDELSENGILNGLRRGNVFVSRGAEIRFSAQNGLGDTAEMGSSLKNEGGVRFTYRYRSRCPLMCYVYYNGMLYSSSMLSASEEEFRTEEFAVGVGTKGIFRIELHEYMKSGEFPGIEWRSFDSVQALSNPIWVE